jgi:hypothetical protein
LVLRMVSAFAHRSTAPHVANDSNSSSTAICRHEVCRPWSVIEDAAACYAPSRSIRSRAMHLAVFACM